MKTNILKILIGAAVISFAVHGAYAQTTNANNPSGVTTQNVSTASSGNNSVNGSPSATGVTGVGTTTPANSTPANSQTVGGSSTNAATGTTNTANATATTNANNSTVFANAANTSSSSTSSSNGTGKLNSARNLLSRIQNARANRTGNNRNLIARLLAAGSQSGNRNNSSSVGANIKTARVTTSNATQNNSGTSAQVVNFDLIFFEQKNNGDTNSTVVQKTVTSADIIAAINDVTSNNFSANSKLIWVTDSNNASNPGTIAVVDGDRVVDVSDFFTVSNSQTQVSGTTTGLQSVNGVNDLNKAQLAALKNGNFRNALATPSTYSILYVTFDSSGGANNSSVNSNTSDSASDPLVSNLNFSVIGFNVTSPITNNATSSDSSTPDEVNANVSGTGTDTKGNPAVVKGTVTIRNNNQ